jgi:CSLREA domain-containing protein
MKLTSRRFYTRRALILLLAISLAVISRLLTVEAASTFIVNTLSDTPDAAPGNGACADANGLCTLRAAIQEANALAGIEAISFSITGTINLTSALPDLSSLTINGPGSSQLTVRRDTGGDYRIFSIPGADVSISGLTVTNGKTPDGGNTSSEGGGIFIFAGSLKLNDVNITGNRTGAGVVTPGNPFAADGASGGGLASHAALTMTNCRVTGNSAGKGADGVAGIGGFGGGIYFTIGSTLTDVVVDGNRAGDGGTGTNPSTGNGVGGSAGGIFAFPAGIAIMNRVTVTNNTTGNSVGGAAGQGGGILFWNSGAQPVRGFIFNSTISNNQTGNSLASPLSSSRGGGIYNLGLLTIAISTVSGNRTGSLGSGVGGGGAGIWNEGGITIENSTISGNAMGGSNDQASPNAAGGITNVSSARITNCTITGNSASTKNISGVGGSESPFSPTILSNTIIAQNGTRDVGGLFVSLGHNLIGNGDGATGLDNSDIVGTSNAPINALLGPLADNGSGPPFTHALLAGSPALDAGSNELAVDADNVPFVIDERGSTRIIDGPDADSTATVDIGAYEFIATLEGIPDRTINEDTSTTVFFSTGDGQPPVTSVTASSSNQSLVPKTNLTLGSQRIRGLRITPLPNQSGTTTITVTVNYSGGGILTQSFLLTVSPVNDAPVNNVPVFAATEQEIPLVFSPANPISITDVDAGTNPLSITVTATHGTFSLSSTTGLQFLVGDGNDDSTMTFTGPSAAINTGLNNSTFKPNDGFSGTATLQIISSDQGHTGTGGPQTTTANLSIQVRKKGDVFFTRTVYDVYEDGDLATITLRRASGSTGMTTVNYSTSNGTANAGDSCGSGVDYLPASGSVSFDSDTTEGSFTVKICNDSANEDNETINLSLTNDGSPGTLYTATLIIKNDEAPVLLSDELTAYAVALDLVNQTRDPFSLTNVFNMSMDQRRRVSLFVWRLGLLPGDTNSSVSVTARDDEGRNYVFPVDALVPVPAVNDVTQVVVRLPDNVIRAPRDLRVKVTLRGVNTNESLVKIGIP